MEVVVINGAGIKKKCEEGYMMQVWILTEEFDAWDQYGEYFREVYFKKPTVKQLEIATGKNMEFCNWLL